MKTLHRIGAAFFVMFALVWTSQTGRSAEAGRAEVNWNDVHQRIDGFGASSAWRHTWTVGQIDMFFSTNNGIGLSLLRSRIAPDGTSVETGIMTMARARGARVWSTPWSPPAAFKDSGSVNGGNYLGGDATNTAYARQLASYAAKMNSFPVGVKLYAISIQNEPDANVTYESCHWTAQQFHDFIPYLYNALAATNLSDIKIMLPEQMNWRLPLAVDAMNDVTTSNMVGILAAHGYGSSSASLNRYGKALWETEDSHLSSSGPYDGSMADGIYWATRIHSFLTVAEVNAWNYWWLISANPDNEGLTDQSGNPAKRMYVLGQWSRFVRPDFYRIGVNNNSSALISAYKEPLSGRIAIVAVNPNTDIPIDQTFALTNVSMTGSVVPWITSSNLSLANQPAVEVSNSMFTWQLPASSVVTFVGQADITNSPPTLQPIADRTIGPGVSLVITNVATDPEPFQTLTFNLLNGPPSATVNSSNGVFSWRPLVAEANTTNLFTVQVADNGSPCMTDQQSFTVTVDPVTRPQISGGTWSNGRYVFQIGGAVGPDYAIQVSSNLIGWNTLFVTNSPPVPFQWVDTDVTNWPSRFYRVKIGPPLP